jgi:phospholipid/cholesterol/gamma-HCH transport system substrate-binding protein
MTSHFKNMLIGFFVIAAGALVLFILLFLHPSVGDEEQILYVRFADIDKINVGTRVTFAGKTVGEVVGIEQVEKDRMGPADAYGNLYVYQLKLAVDSHLKVYNTDEIAARTSGLLGEKSVAILPIAPKANQVPKLIEKNQILYASETGSVEQVMKEFKEVADKADTALASVSTLLDDFKHEEVVKKISITMENLSEITGALNQPEALAAIVTNVQDLTKEIATRIPPSWDTLDASLESFKEVSNEVREGRGSLGRILVRDDMYLQMQALLNKGETLMDDMNHYGLLYHLDKGWQRARARRLNLMQSLSSPQEFRNYFNDEIDQISTSLSRVSMLLDKTCDCYPCLLDDREFSKVFAELLRRVDAMQEELKLYNIQLNDCNVKKTELTLKQ